MRTRRSHKLVRELEALPLERKYFADYDYDILKKIPVRTKKNKAQTQYADAVIMIDTETSKKTHTPANDDERRNHVCIWSLAIRTQSVNIACLWGRKPSELVACIKKIRDIIQAEEVYIYIHNLSYDWIFLRKFFFREFGFPEHQLNTKPLYPITISFANGIILKDSLCLSQRSLEKWGEDMQVEHAKAVGKWDYDIIRDFDTWTPTEDELIYATNDVLCGVECIDAMMKAIHKTITSMPFTMTGVPRGESRNEGRKHNAHQWAVGILPKTYARQELDELEFHGGFTHTNRFIKDIVFPSDYPCVGTNPECEDIASSYPFNCIANKMPCERFFPCPSKKITPEYIRRNSEDYAFLIHLKAFGVRLRNPRFPMPSIAKSKCLSSVNIISDNGRVLNADYIEMWLNDVDFLLIYEHYHFDRMILEDVECARKDYLPRWFTDYIYKLFEKKTRLKGHDPVLYAIEKAKLNAASFGMCAQRPVKPDIVEDYQTGEYKNAEDFDFEKEYQKHLNNRNTFLPYIIGVYITSYAQKNLFELGACVADGAVWLYSDTDSVYATAFDKEKLKAYNDKRIHIMEERGYHGIEHEGKVYHLGIAENDGVYMQFKALHSKCYVKRPLVAYGDNFVMGGDLKITVAGVPKRGAKSLHNNIDLFQEGFCFDGETSGKLQHTHIYVPDIYTDEHGNEVGDSIDLTPCSYIINDPNTVDFEKLLEEEIAIQTYDDYED